ncbi:hypothetical protein [Pseudorhodobacter sp.]|uniref:hypothetical protein n=1 Tax=Pseudorhodobacter sp. TaxID=1934400 RepID=UPI002649924B|nr:hypothetical protein [Pseudorhodobacter sp.]MDN5785853.1 hypothetical protein [Pseudorhodobacter sp.]
MAISRVGGRVLQQVDDQLRRYRSVTRHAEPISFGLLINKPLAIILDGHLLGFRRIVQHAEHCVKFGELPQVQIASLKEGTDGRR